MSKGKKTFIDHDRILPSPGSALSQPSHEKKLFEISNLIEWGYNNDDRCANAINEHSNVNLSMRNIIITFATNLHSCVNIT